MTGRRRSSRAAALAGAVLLLAVPGLAGCADDGGGSSAADPTPMSGTPAPSLPPGDPGLDAPAAADPLTEGPLPSPAEEEEHHHEEPVRAIGDAAFVPAGDLGAMLGGRWVLDAAVDGAVDGAGAAPVPDCAAGGSDGGTPVVAATRSWSARSTPGRQVVEQVAVHASVSAADAAVRATAERLPGCGATDVTDPRLGSSAVTALVDGDRLTVVAAEDGVVVVLRESPATADEFAWAGLVDLAIGTSCEAGPHGCH